MKAKLIILISIITLSSCKTQSYREKFSYYFDLSDQLLFIESNIINSDTNTFSVDIHSRSCYSINTLISNFEISVDSVKIKTIRETDFKKIVDTSFTVSKKKILEEINYQKENAKDITVVAGYYQHIQISRDNKAIRYPTTKVADYLIEFLETGKNH